MPSSSSTFGVQLTNVPIVNLRAEFRIHYRLARKRELLPQSHDQPFRTPYLIWLASPAAGITLIMTRTLLSVEAYTSFAAEFEGARHGKLSPEFKKSCRTPFSLGGRSTAINYYEKLPALIEQAFSMSRMSPQTWPVTRKLYSEVRNPLFHGHELSDITPDQLADLFEHVANIYRWLDLWFNPEEFIPGSRKAFAFD